MFTKCKRKGITTWHRLQPEAIFFDNFFYKNFADQQGQGRSVGQKKKSKVQESQVGRVKKKSVCAFIFFWTM